MLSIGRNFAFPSSAYFLPEFNESIIAGGPLHGYGGHIGGMPEKCRDE
jgi:hypothetical protein